MSRRKCCCPVPVRQESSREEAALVVQAGPVQGEVRAPVAVRAVRAEQVEQAELEPLKWSR